MSQLYPHVKKDNKTINGWTCFNKFILYIHYNFSIGWKFRGISDSHIFERNLWSLSQGGKPLPFDPSLSPGTPNNQFFMVVSTFQLDDSKSLHKKWWFQVPGMASSKHLWIAIRVFLRSWGARQVVGVAVKRAGPVGRFVFLWPRSWFFKNPSQKLKVSPHENGWWRKTSVFLLGWPSFRGELAANWLLVLGRVNILNDGGVLHLIPKNELPHESVFVLPCR